MIDYDMYFQTEGLQTYPNIVTSFCAICHKYCDETCT